MVVRFRITGPLRFLSHAETVRVFQRACVRAGVQVRHSQGFNPRPRLSLPLPRSVGVETDDDLLYLTVESSPTTFDRDRFTAALAAQLPQGCEVLSVDVAKAKMSFRAAETAYVLSVRCEYVDDKMTERIAHLLESESLKLERTVDAAGNTRPVDVRGYLKSIKVEGGDEDTVLPQAGQKAVTMIVECRISPAGSIRVDEILELLELDTEKMTAPIRRQNVKWQDN